MQLPATRLESLICRYIFALQGEDSAVHILQQTIFITIKFKYNAKV